MTKQNTSSAVMQQRREPNNSLDDFPTPPWATRGICNELLKLELIDPGMTCREPCANRGYMVRPLLEYFPVVEASDVHDYGFGYDVADYLWGDDQHLVDWTFLNPPFKLAEQFIHRALRTSSVGVVCIVRGAFGEGVARYNKLYSVRPPSYEFQPVERIPMVKGRYNPKAKSATCYTWFVWLTRHGNNADTRKRWIPPCRKELQYKGDVICLP